MGIFVKMRDKPLTLASFHACAALDGAERVACARTHARALLERESASDIVKDLEQQYPGGTTCHLLGHFVGQEIFRRTASVERALSECNPLSCAGACAHGAIGAAFMSVAGTKVSEEELEHPSKDLIESIGDDLCVDGAACHAVGHVLFALSDSIEEALASCERLASDDTVTSCYHGIFMENHSPTFASLELGGKQKNYRDPDDLLSPCRALPARYDRACFLLLYLNQNRTFDEKHISDEHERMQLRRSACESLDAPRRPMCFLGFGWSLAYEGTVARAIATCLSSGTGREQSMCAYGASDYYSSYGTSPAEVIVACNTVSSPDVRYGCYSGYFRWVSIANGVPLAQACESAPEDSCVAALAEYTSAGR